MSRGARIALAVGILVVILLAAGWLVVTLLSATRLLPISESADAPAGSSVAIDVPNAAISVSPSTDDEVHVTLEGRYTGSAPTLEVTTDDGETSISGGCPRGWFVFSRCSIRIDVTLPAELDVTIRGQNGALTATDLEGDLDLSTSNGAILIDEASGALELDTTNGRIELTNTLSTEVAAETTNGAVRLAFTEPPDDVSARSTNGEVVVRVPDGTETYRVDATTTNGRVESTNIRTDPDSDRSISAHTTNGGVTVEHDR